MMCHGADHEKMAKHPHAVAADSRNFGCVGCHGMSEKHADNPAEAKPDQRFKGKGAMNASEASAVCMVCHEGQNNKKLLLWAGSTPPQADVGCTSCHTRPRQQGPGLQQGRAGRRLPCLPQGHAGRDEQAVAASDPGRQDELLGLPRAARLGWTRARQARHHQRDLLPVPRREAARTCTTTSRCRTTARAATTRTAATLLRC